MKRILFAVLILTLATMACQLPGLTPLSPPETDSVQPTFISPQPVTTNPIPLDGSLTSLYQQVIPGVVSIITDAGSQGSGFVYDTEGHVITNFHVVEGASTVEVDFTSGRGPAHRSGAAIERRRGLRRVQVERAHVDRRRRHGRGQRLGPQVPRPLTAKHYLPGPDLLLSGELQLVNPHVGGYAYRQLVGYAMATWFPGDGFMIDLGYGKFGENLRIKNLDRDAIDLNVHWFATSHIELVLISRAEFIGGGQGGPTGAYSMLMGHYRL